MDGWLGMKHVRGALLASVAWDTMASALSYPDFLKLWEERGWPEFLVLGIHYG